MLPRPDHRGRWTIPTKRAMPLYCVLAQLQQHARQVPLIIGAFLLIDANRVAAEKITLLFGVPAFWEGDEWCWDVAQSGRSIAVWICECVS